MKLKTPFNTLVLVLLLLVASCKVEESFIVGEWVIETIDGQTLPEEEKLAFMILAADGRCEQGTDGVCELGGDNTIQGKWKHSPERNELIIENADGTTNTYTAVHATANELSIMHDITPITFTRNNN